MGAFSDNHDPEQVAGMMQAHYGEARDTETSNGLAQSWLIESCQYSNCF